MSGSAHFSHSTAAALYGIPLPRRIESSSALHVTVVAPQHPPQAQGIVGHRVSSAALRERDGLPICSPEQAWARLAPLLGHDELVMAGDHLVRRKRPLSSIERLSEVISPGARGAARMRRALLEVRSGTDSPKETQLRLVLVHAGLPEPVIGHTVFDADGFFVATPDLAYPVERVALEYEGDHHRSDRRTFADDILRRELLEDAGWVVIRVISDHLVHPALLAGRVSRILAARG